MSDTTYGMQHAARNRWRSVRGEAPPQHALLAVLVSRDDERHLRTHIAERAHLQSTEYSAHVWAFASMISMDRQATIGIKP
jgi:hypothetical protein